MSKVLIKSNNIQMSVEYFTDLLKQMNVKYSVNKNSIEFKTREESIKEGIEFPIELSDEEMLCLMKIAHEKNITFNELCNQVLKEELDKLDKAEKKAKLKKTRK